MVTKQIAGMIAPGMIIALWATTAMAQAAVFSGQIVSATGGKLTIQERSGQRHVLRIARDATVLREGQPAKLDDLKSTDEATVTVDEGMVAVAIDAKSASGPPRKNMDSATEVLLALKEYEVASSALHIG